MSGENIVDSWSSFDVTLNNIINKYVPVSRAVLNRENYQEILHQQRIYRCNKTESPVWIRYLHCKTPANHENYKVARNKCKYAIRNSQHSYERNLVDNIKTKPKHFWKYVRSNTKTKDKITKVLNQNNTLTSSDSETADVMNNYFPSVFVSDEHAYTYIHIPFV